jgi:hypothetical protein
VTIIKLFPARENLISDIPAGDKKIDDLFFQCSYVSLVLLGERWRERGNATRVEGAR